MLLLPGCSTWYSPQIVATHQDGIIAYGAKNSIFIYTVDGTANDGRLLFYTVVKDACPVDKNIVALSFAKDRDSKRFTSVSSDGCVKVWKIVDGTVEALASHRLHETSKKAEVVALDWTCDSRWLVSVDALGTVISFRPDDNHFVQCSKLLRQATVLACSPTEPEVIAAGCRGGLFMVVKLDAQGGEVLHRFRQMYEDACCLVWRPDGRYFAGAARETSFHVWDTVTGDCVASGGSNSSYKKPWVQLAWKSNKTLAVGGLETQIRQWTLNEVSIKEGDKEQRQGIDGVTKGKELPGMHSGLIMNVAAIVDKDVVVSFGQDRFMVSYLGNDVATRIPMLGGYVYALAPCPTDPRRIAIACGDAGIRIWTPPNLTSGAVSGTDAFALVNKVAARVTAIDWFPPSLLIGMPDDVRQKKQQEREGWLAFGTDEGRVGVFWSVFGKKLPTPTLSSGSHKKTVYGVKWAPKLMTVEQSQPWKSNGVNGHAGAGPGGDADQSKKHDSKEEQHCLLSCGDGIIYVHSADLRGPGINFDDRFCGEQKSDKNRPFRTSIVVRDDFKAIAFGNMDGSVEVFSSPVVVKLWLVVCQSAPIMSMSFHPLHSESMNASGQDDEKGFSSLLAFGTNKGRVFVVDCPVPEISGVNADGQMAKTIGQPKFEMKGHSARIPALSWSSAHPGQIFSGGYDGALRIWDLTKGDQSAVSNPSKVYKMPLKRYRVFAALTTSSGIDATSKEVDETVYFGGDDFCLYSMKVSEMDEFVAPAVQVNGVEEIQEEKPVKEEVKVEEPRPTSPASSATSRQPLTAHQTAPFDRTRTKSLFSWSKHVDSHGLVQPLKDLQFMTSKVGMERKEDGEIEEDYTHLGVFFPGRQPTKAQLAREVAEAKDGRWSKGTDAGLYAGDLTQVFAEAVSSGNVTEQMLAVAPMHSWDMWANLTEAYAVQCEAAGKFRPAAASRLALGQIKEAIRCLCSAGFFHDALAITRLRCPGDTDQVDAVLKEWIQFCKKSSGSQQGMAKCYLALGDPNAAAKVLASKHDPAFVAVAARLAIKSVEEGGQEGAGAADADLVGLKAITMLLDAGEVTEALEIAKLYQRWHWFLPLLAICKVFKDQEPVKLINFLTWLSNRLFSDKDTAGDLKIDLKLEGVDVRPTIEIWMLLKSHFGISATSTLSSTGPFLSPALAAVALSVEAFEDAKVVIDSLTYDQLCLVLRAFCGPEGHRNDATVEMISLERLQKLVGETQEGEVKTSFEEIAKGFVDRVKQKGVSVHENFRELLTSLYEDGLCSVANSPHVPGEGGN